MFPPVLIINIRWAFLTLSRPHFIPRSFPVHPRSGTTFPGRSPSSRTLSSLKVQLLITLLLSVSNMYYVICINLLVALPLCNAFGP
uniref:Uncharacterized protein n=1 Tax=Ixodes ricinus TaxID=34613 RepID=A0A6B0U901_IXORI